MLARSAPLAQPDLKQSYVSNNKGPAMSIVRSILTQNNPQRLASFNADWAFPQFRSFYRTLTAVWGCVTVAQLMLHALLVFTLPISLMLVLGQILSFAVIMPTAHWSMNSLRKNKPIFDQLRQQRDAAISH